LSDAVKGGGASPLCRRFIAGIQDDAAFHAHQDFPKLKSLKGRRRLGVGEGNKRGEENRCDGTHPSLASALHLSVTVTCF
jgi:hypothetical protein